MAFVNPNVLAQIFGKQGAINTATPSQQQSMIQMLAGAGAGMTQAANQPGANFAQALGGGAQGMLQGQQAAQQYQMNQLQMQKAQAEMARDAERQERLRKILGGGTTFASQIDARPAATPQLGGGNAQASPYTGGPGAMTARYESGNDPTAVSTGRGDPGGVSYGANQLSSAAGTMANFLQSPEGQPYAAQFQGLDPGSEQFGQRFQQVASQSPEFAQAQQQYLQRTHVQPVMAAASRAGMPVNNPAIQAALHSQATQHSGDGNIQIINETMARIGPNSGPEEILDTLYDVREKYAVDAIRRNGERQGLDPEAIEQTIAGVRNRYSGERQETLGMLGERQVGGMLGGQAQPAAQPTAPAMNGYQMREAQQQADSPFANLPPQTRQILAMMEPEDAFKAMIDMQQGGDTPDRILEAQMIAAETGEPVGTVLARMRKILPGGGDELTAANRTREQMIEMQIRNNPDVDPRTIRNSVYKRYQISRDPVTGQAQLVDTYQTPQQGESGGGSATVTPADEVAPSDVDASLAFGAPGVLADWQNALFDMLGKDLPRPEVEDAIRRVTSLGIQGDVLLSEQFSGRVSNQLLDMIGQLKAKPATFFEGPSRGKTSLEEMRRLIQRDLERNIRVQESNTQGPQAKKEAQLAAEKLSDYLNEINSVLNAWGTYGQQGQQGTAPALQGPESGSAGGPPEGWSQEMWDVLTDEEKAQLTGGE